MCCTFLHSAVDTTLNRNVFCIAEESLRCGLEEKFSQLDPCKTFLKKKEKSVEGVSTAELSVIPRTYLCQVLSHISGTSGDHLEFESLTVESLDVPHGSLSPTFMEQT